MKRDPREEAVEGFLQQTDPLSLYQGIPRVGATGMSKTVSTLFRDPKPLDCPNCHRERFRILIGPGPSRVGLFCPNCKTQAMRILTDESPDSGLIQYSCSGLLCDTYWAPVEMMVPEEAVHPESQIPRHAFQQFRCATSDCSTWFPPILTRKPQLDDTRAKNLGLFVPDPN